MDKNYIILDFRNGSVLQHGDEGYERAILRSKELLAKQRMTSLSVGLPPRGDR